ncbi:hypothetical protein IFO69_11330 [Echinicola sp. CAU 1574]|uniref:GAF domain-containing protein n=1 Tax=Echinicola arenosa TaxID=2774144 RepID=A0ABR9ALY1_9BACT|nr:GAF domain-containing protein [Echinicola arenosa]MBD8489336.1 hypothetical protein [Echinicola arenosa]
MDLKSLWKNTEYTFGLSNDLSFQPLINWWEQKVKEGDLYTPQVQRFLEDIKKYPILNQDKIDVKALQEDKEAYAFIVQCIFPVSLNLSRQLFLMSKPFEFDIIYSSRLFQEMFSSLRDSPACFIEAKQTEMYYSKLFHAYQVILKKFYSIEIEESNSLIYKMININGIDKYYYLEINVDFVDAEALMELPSKETIMNSCSGTTPCMNDFNRLQQVLPLDKFKFNGFSIGFLKDFTETESIAELNTALLNDHDFASPKFLETIERSVKSLLGNAKIKVGIAAFQKFQDKFLISEKRLANSYLIRQICQMDCDKNYESAINFLSTISAPIFLNEFDECPEANSSYKTIKQLGIEEIIILPLQYGDSPVGVLEICSEEKGILNNMMLSKLKNINQPLAMALQKNSKQFEYEVQKVIRKNYTAIQPSIEWKFLDVAVQNILDQENGKNSKLQPVIFDDVYPLYAAVDIRNSSATRVESIQKDLQQQLKLGSDIISQALESHYLPVLEKMKFKIGQMLQDIQLILISEDESKINQFLLDELEPLFKHLKKVQPELEPLVNDYFSTMDAELGILYENRKAFEDSLSIINQAIGQHIEQAQVQAQKMFPHYFEKYKTDGIDYNIYIGQSLVKDRMFDPIYLKNLKLWQLTTLCESAFLSQSLKSKLPIPLETTQLLLVHSAPLSISFRMDERKFDVEGAYNIRYEIMKKRIDKALILNSKERLTQPGTIAIIYTQPKEAEEYLDYIYYLQNKGLLGDKVEQLDLEDLQGVNGLKALRINLADIPYSDYPNKQKDKIKTDNQK